MPGLVGHLFLNLPAEFKAGFFNGLLERILVDIVRIMPLHAKFLLRDIGLGKFHAVQHANRLLDARLAVAAAHAVHAVSHENAFIAFLFVVVVLMLMAMALVFVMVLAMLVSTTAVMIGIAVVKVDSFGVSLTTDCSRFSFSAISFTESSPESIR